MRRFGNFANAFLLAELQAVLVLLGFESGQVPRVELDRARARIPDQTTARPIRECLDAFSRARVLHSRVAEERWFDGRGTFAAHAAVEAGIVEGPRSDTWPGIRGLFESGVASKVVVHGQPTVGAGHGAEGAAVPRRLPRGHRERTRKELTTDRGRLRILLLTAQKALDAGLGCSERLLVRTR